MLLKTQTFLIILGCLFLIYSFCKDFVYIAIFPAA